MVPAHPTPSIQPALLDALADTFVEERAVLDQLGAVLYRQRAAVGTDDMPAVNDAVFAMHRLLLSLGETREQRRAIHQLLGCGAGRGIDQLEVMLGDTMTQRLRTERDTLQRTARGLSIEIDLNRQLIQEKLGRNRPS